MLGLVRGLARKALKALVATVLVTGAVAVAVAALGAVGGVDVVSATATAVATCPVAPLLVRAHGDRVLGLPIADLAKGAHGGRWNARGASAVIRKPYGQLAAYDDDGDSTVVLKVHHPRNHGTGASANRGERLVKWNVHFEAAPLGVFPCRSIVLSYDVMFLPGWTWSGGGKMHGLYVGRGAASGGTRSKDGASVRVMWQRDGGAIAYVYAPLGVVQPPAWAAVTRKGAKYGTGLFHADFARALRVGRWNRVQLGVRLNSFGAGGSPRGDGAVKLTVNGVTREFVGVVLGASPAMDIERILFSTFAGGPYAMERDGHQLFKNFAVYRY